MGELYSVVRVAAPSPANWRSGIAVTRRRGGRRAPELSRGSSRSNSGVGDGTDEYVSRVAGFRGAPPIFASATTSPSRCPSGICGRFCRFHRRGEVREAAALARAAALVQRGSGLLGQRSVRLRFQPFATGVVLLVLFLCHSVERRSAGSVRIWRTASLRLAANGLRAPAARVISDLLRAG